MAKRRKRAGPKRLYRRRHHDTERAAAEAIYPFLTEIQEQVLLFFRSGWPRGFTQQEATEALGLPVKSTIRTRCSELAEDKLLEDTGRRKRHPPSKRFCIIWRYRPEQLELPFGDNR